MAVSRCALALALDEEVRESLGAVDGALQCDSPQCLSTTSRVVVAVLAARSTVQVNHDLEVVVPCPPNHTVEVLGLTLDVRLAARNVVGPVPNWHTDVVETGG